MISKCTHTVSNLKTDIEEHQDKIKATGSRLDSYNEMNLIEVQNRIIKGQEYSDSLVEEQTYDDIDTEISIVTT